jgi:predicted metal-dependent hydrolase
MRARQPKFDFSQSRAHWAADREFSQLVNGMSVGIPPLERFLNRVMARARQAIRDDDPLAVQLRADITTFIRQESSHYAVHDAMNAMLKRDGYEGITAIEQEIEAHYNRLLETKSLAFLCAYCEGFETIGPVAAMGWCGDAYDSQLAGADRNITMMWRWHFMEEYEHRNVCHDVYQTIHGGYFLRIYGFFYQRYFLRKLANKVTAYMIEVDQAKMTPEQRAASSANLARLNRLMRGGFWKKFGRVLTPWYKPHSIAMPTRWQQIESEIDRDWLAGPQSTAGAAQ